MVTIDLYLYDEVEDDRYYGSSQPFWIYRVADPPQATIKEWVLYGSDGWIGGDGYDFNPVWNKKSAMYFLETHFPECKLRDLYFVHIDGHDNVQIEKH